MQYLGAVIGLGTTLLSYFGAKYLDPKSNPVPRKTFGPCMKVEKNQIDTPFEIELPDGSCSSTERLYDLVYLSPANNPLDNSNIRIYNSDFSSNPDNVLSFNSTLPRFQFTNQTKYFPMVLTGTAPKVQSLLTGVTSLGNVVGSLESTPNPLQASLVNMSPQCYSLNGGTTKFATFLSLPLISQTDLGPSSAESASLVIIPGLSSPLASNGINVPCVNTDAPLVQQNKFSTGLASELYLIAFQDTTFYLELNGAYGGSVLLYSNGVDPTTLQPITIKSFEGGQPGTVFGLYTLKQYDVLKVFLASPGDDSTQWITPNIFTFDGNGQGGQGTMFGGTNGGGASYAVHYQLTRYADQVALGFNEGPLKAAFANEPGLLVCVAGGGGGASRNASGGAAGFSNVPGSEPYLVYAGTNSKPGPNGPELVSPFGSTGGPINVTGFAKENKSRGSLGLSGGGGAQTIGGASNVPNQLNNGAAGSKIQPFIGQTSTMSGSGGGSATATDIGSGGGGGGGGHFGGGAGGYNGQSKPNNLHGAGGGGSSWQGLLKNTSKQNVSMNAYRSTSVWPVQDTPYDFNNTNRAQRYGSMIIGWPRA